MAPFYTIRPVKATGSRAGEIQTLDSTKQREWHGVCSYVFMRKNLISAALAALALGELRKKTMATQKRINEEARLHSLHSRTDVDVSGSASTSTAGSAISR